MKRIKGYEPLKNWVVPCYTYMEGDECENYWVDTQNAMYYTLEDEDENGLIDGKKYWLIFPYKPENVTVTKENINDIVRWFVDFATNTEDIELEWDFDNHRVIKNNEDSQDN